MMRLLVTVQTVINHSLCQSYAPSIKQLSKQASNWSSADCVKVAVMQVGEAGLGKSTFIQNLQAAFQPELPSPRSPATQPQADSPNLYEVFKHSPEQLCTEVTINTDASRFHYLLQVKSLVLIAHQKRVCIAHQLHNQNQFSST